MGKEVEDYQQVGIWRCGLIGEALLVKRPEGPSTLVQSLDTARMEGNCATGGAG